ncbi:hypothetical protein ACHWQZ_G016133 [Mnemiopsis leidyi]
MGFYFQHFYREWMKDHYDGELIEGEPLEVGFPRGIDDYCGVRLSEPPRSYECYTRRGSETNSKKAVRRGSSEYSDQSYNEYQIGEASPDTSPMHYRPRSLTPPPDHRRDYVPQPQPLSYIELNRLPVVKLQGHELHTKCCCEKPWQKDEEATQLLCGHKLHSTCACKLMETGVCPICKTAEVIDDKDREIRIDLSGFNF